MKILLISICCLALFVSPLNAQQTSVWFGTSSSASKGIYHAKFDTQSGKLSPATLAAEVGSPGFLAMHPDGTKIYAVCRTDAGPSVAGYQIQKDGQLELLNAQPIDDGGAAHLCLHPSGKMLITAQYGAGSVAVFPVDDKGIIAARSQLHKQGPGSRVVGNRQDSSHAHWTGFDAAGKFAFVPDLGMDGVVIYKVNEQQTGLEKHGFAKCPPGSGPRHMKFADDFAYVLNELSLSVTSFKYDRNGEMKQIATVQTLTDQQKAEESFNSASEIRIHPSKKFAYSANRGHDSITAFKLAGGGKLSLIEVEPIRGAFPRNFNLDPSGKWLLAAGADSDTVAVFEIDQQTGKLMYIRGRNIHVPSPICVLFAK